MEVEPDSGLCIWNGSGGADQRRSAAALTYYGAQGLRLREPELTAPLTLTMTMDNRTWRRLEQLAQSRGRPLPCLSRRGLAVSLARGKRRSLFGLLWRSYFWPSCTRRTGSGLWRWRGMDRSRTADSGSGGGVRSQVLGKGRRDSQ